jgi:dTMP kinase
VGDFRPDLTLILDLPVEQGLARADARAVMDDGSGTRYERMGVDFHRRLREGFLEIARREPGRCVVIDAAPPAEAVAQAIMKAVRERLPMMPR